MHDLLLDSSQNEQMRDERLPRGPAEIHMKNRFI